jgi:hypothetical protein
MADIDDVIKEQINRIQDEASTIKLATLESALGTLMEARELDDMLKDLKSAIGKIYKDLKEIDIPAKFEEAGVTSITIGGYRFTKSESIRASMKDKIAAYDWLRNNDLEDLITETVNSSTLSATARTLMEEGKELPEDMFNVYIMNNTSVTKA